MNHLNPETITFLQWALLLVDGAGIFASYDIMRFYRRGKHHHAVFAIYGFYFVLFWVFLALAFSDLCVVMKWPIWWATLPIIRGHVFRTPVVIALLWMIHKQSHHAPARQ